jgi:hypothetical protein
MANTERDIATAVLAASHRNAVELGLRFDRVVVRVLGDLRTFVKATAPSDITLVVTVSAPIRTPAKTLTALKEEIARMGAGSIDHTHKDIQGNAVRVCVARHALAGAPGLIGFVHNPGSSSTLLVELARQWLRTQT